MSAVYRLQKGRVSVRVRRRSVTITLPWPRLVLEMVYGQAWRFLHLLQLTFTSFPGSVYSDPGCRMERCWEFVWVSSKSYVSLGIPIFLEDIPEIISQLEQKAKFPADWEGRVGIVQLR